MAIEVDFKMLRMIFPIVTNAKKPHPIMIRGRHGVGKSEVVYQFADEKGMPVVERRASQMTEGDIVGLPVKKGDSTAWNPPDWYKEACRNPVVLFLDELDRATLEVRQGIFELADSRKINGHKLHPGTLIFAAVNGGKHGGSYQVAEQDPAEVDRWTIYDVEPSPEDWFAWGKEVNDDGVQNIDNVIISFLRENPAFLEHKDEFDPTEVYPSRRSWKRCNDAIVNAELITPGKTNRLLLNVAMGFVGHEASTKLHDYVQSYQKVVKWQDILDKGKLDLVKDFSINDHLTLVEKIENGPLKKKLSAKRLNNLAAYWKTLPSEVGMKLWRAMGSSDHGTENTIAFHKIDGVKAHIAVMNNEASKDEE